jgi:A/G-specific adenine glycosylase
MLQQTQVTRAIPRFTSFVDRWPVVEDLAGATNTDVLAEWSGLGYNSRAIRLRDAAALVARDGWPKTPEGLRALPGVGPYTANAIASISFGIKVPAVDTNLQRVLGRWQGEALEGAELLTYATTVVGEPAGDWNQALMDLASTICHRRTPDCDRCPVAAACSDPNVMTPSVRQSRFEGSRRQLRGALVRAHLNGDDLTQAGIALGRTSDEISQAVSALQAEGLIASH